MLSTTNIKNINEAEFKHQDSGMKAESEKDILRYQSYWRFKYRTKRGQNNKWILRRFQTAGYPSILQILAEMSGEPKKTLEL